VKGNVVSAFLHNNSPPMQMIYANPHTQMTTMKPTAFHPASNWDDLQFFLAVATQGSISAAARRLGVNHSTVLRRLASLEAHLGSRLFDRLPAGYALTDAGQELAEHLGGVAEQIESAQRRMKSGDLAIRGVVRLTTTDTLLGSMLMPHLVRFGRLHPQVEIQVTVNNSFLNLTQREADVAIRGSNRPPENLVGRRAGRIRTAPYAARSYLKSLGRTHTHEDWRWVGPDDSLAHIEQARWLRRNVPPERVAIRVDSLLGMADAVAAGAGVGMLLCPLGDARRELVRLEEPLPALDTEVWVLTHPDLRRVARVRAFTEFMFAALGGDERLGHG
jgi:DNA-binding transcriptional LysR family regulator